MICIVHLAIYAFRNRNITSSASLIANNFHVTFFFFYIGRLKLNLPDFKN